MNILEYRDAVIADLKSTLGGEFRQVIAYPARFDLEAARRLLTVSPTLAVSFLGVPRMGLSNIGQFEANCQMAAYVLCRNASVAPANDEAITLAERAASHVSLRTWGLSGVQPALVTRLDNLHTVDMAQVGISIASFAWSQNITIGRDVYHEDEYGEPLPAGFDIRELETWPQNRTVNETVVPAAWPVVDENDV